MYFFSLCLTTQVMPEPMILQSHSSTNCWMISKVVKLVSTTVLILQLFLIFVFWWLFSFWWFWYAQLPISWIKMRNAEDSSVRKAMKRARSHVEDPWHQMEHRGVDMLKKTELFHDIHRMDHMTISRLPPKMEDSRIQSGSTFPPQDCGGICNPTSLKLGTIREGNESRDFFRIADIQIAPWSLIRLRWRSQHDPYRKLYFKRLHQ